VARFDRTIPPGQEGEIVASMDTSKYQGRLAKAVQVTTNDPDHRMTQLRLVADVRNWVEVLPSWSASLTADLGKGASKTLYLKSPDPEQPLVSPSASAKADWLQATVETIEAGSDDAGKGDYRLVVELLPSTPAGPSSGKVEIRSGERRVDLPVVARVHGPISIIPSALNLIGQPEGSGRPDRLSGVVTLQARPEQPEFRIQGIQSDDERLMVEPIPDPENRRHRIAARWTAKENKGDFTGTIRIETDHPTMKEIEIPFRVRIL
jgi:hypothetical protein